MIKESLEFEENIRQVFVCLGFSLTEMSRCNASKVITSQTNIYT